MKSPVVIFLISLVSMILAIGISHIFNEDNSIVRNFVYGNLGIALFGVATFIGWGFFNTIAFVYKTLFK